MTHSLKKVKYCEHVDCTGCGFYTYRHTNESSDLYRTNSQWKVCGHTATARTPTWGYLRGTSDDVLRISSPLSYFSLDVFMCHYSMSVTSVCSLLKSVCLFFVSLCSFFLSSLSPHPPAAGSREFVLPTLSKCLQTGNGCCVLCLIL